MKWDKTSLGNVISLEYGKSLPDRNRKTGKIPVYGSGGIGGFHDKSLVSGPGIIVGRKGTVGSVYWETEDFFPIDTVYYVVPNEKEITMRFSYYLLKYLPLNSLNTDAAVPGLNRNNALRLKIKLPKLEAQNQITEILSAYDDLIENNRRRIRLLEKSAQLLYNEWFVNLRFPGHEHTKIVNGIPQGWKKARLDRIAAINEKTLKKGFTEKIEYIDISSVKPGSIDETLQYNFDDAPGRARRIVNHGDIIWSCVRPNRRSYAIIWKPCLNLIASTGFVVITPKEVMTAFLYQALTTNEYVGYLTNNAKGVAYPAVTAKDFAKSEILIPSRQPLIEFNEIATQILEHINTLRVQNRKLAQARDILLPRLMNGELVV
jgi:type I restriction enzyme, S subunit